MKRPRRTTESSWRHFTIGIIRSPNDFAIWGGEIRVLNPVVPQFFHGFKWRKTGGAWIKERFPKKPTYEYQLEAFRDAVVDGKPFITTTGEAVKTMKVIDAVYRAAGMQPR